MSTDDRDISVNKRSLNYLRIPIMSLRLCDKPIYDFGTQSNYHWLAISGIISSTWFFVGGKGGSVYA
ncbi:hypothetical protein DIRU0_D13740 [Diutina rugosa]